MSIQDIIFSTLVVLGSFAVIFMVMDSFSGIRDFMKMHFYAKIVKESTSLQGWKQMCRLGMAVMFAEGDTMRASSAILGFTNGRVITQSESIMALVSSSSWKFLWVWIAALIFLVSTLYNHIWIFFIIVGFVLILLNISNSMNLSGRFLFNIGILLLALTIGNDGISSFLNNGNNGLISKIIEYIVVPDVVGITISAFLGVFVGAAISGNLVGIFIALLFVSYGISCPECALIFAIGNEVGTLFPMSFMLSETNLPARKSFIFYAIVVITVWIIDILLLIIVNFDFLFEFGCFSFVIGYTLMYSIIIPIVYLLIRGKVWARVGTGTHEQLSFKTHLYQFDRIYRPHVSIMMIQAEKEIVNLQYRIHKMLGFIIDILDGENIEESLEHVRKYKKIVDRTGKEISDFIISQTSAKINEYISELARERLQAVNLQSQVGALFCDMAEAVYLADKDDYQIIRRCVVSLETLFNLATKRIDSRYNTGNSKESNILLEDVGLLNSKLDTLLQDLGKDSITQVLPYTIEKTRAIIVKIIDNLQ